MKGRSRSADEIIGGIKEGLSGFKLFRDQFRNRHFEFEYPQHWVVGYGHLLVPKGGRVLLVQGPWNKGKCYYVQLSVEIIPLDVDDPTYEYAEEGLELEIHRARWFADEIRRLLGGTEYLSKSLRSWEILSDREVIVDGQRAREVVVAKEAPLSCGNFPVPEGYDPKEGERGIERYVAFQRGPLVYELSYRGAEDEDEIYIEAYNRFLSTFRVLPAHQEEQGV